MPKSSAKAGSSAAAPKPRPASELRRYIRSATRELTPSEKDEWIELLRGHGYPRKFDPFREADAYGGCYFDVDAAEKYIGFIEQCCQHVKGELAGQPLILESFQRSYVANAFGWKRPNNTRRFRKGLKYIPRKNGKSTEGAAILAAMFFVDDEPGAEIYSAAGKKDQAAIIWEISRLMIQAEPEMGKRSQVYTALKSIEDRPYTGRVYRVFSGDDLTNQGLNVHGANLDELHVQRSVDVRDSIIKGMSARTQPFLNQTTTADSNRPSVCNEEVAFARKVMDGEITAPDFLCQVYELTEQDDYRNEDLWYKVNPMLGKSLDIEEFRSDLNEAEASPSRLANFLRYRLNIVTNAANPAFRKTDWDACFQEFSEADLRGQKCIAGFDGASKNDLNALVLFFPHSMRILSYFFAPKENAARRQKEHDVPYLSWAHEGHLILTPGERADQEYIKQFILAKSKEFRFLNCDPKGRRPQFSCDDYNIDKMMQELDAAGLEIVPVRMGYKTLSPPSKELDVLVSTHGIYHNHQPVMDWCVGNTQWETDAMENMKPSKKASDEKIDGVTALVICLARYIVFDSHKSTPYKERGFL